MSESQGRDLKPPEDGMFYENFGFGTFFWYHNFQNEIDAWESTVQPAYWYFEFGCLNYVLMSRFILIYSKANLT